MAECQNQSGNLKNCNCSYDCSKKGNCCECVMSHNSRGEFPACFFTAEAEKTFDRSYEMLVKDREGLL